MNTNGSTNGLREVQERIVAAILAGNFLAPAGRFAGVTGDCVQKWIQRGRIERERVAIPGNRRRASEAPYLAFADAVEEARARCEISTVAGIRDLAKGGQVVERRTTTDKAGRETVTERFSAPDWRALAWLLERGYRENWQLRDHLQVTGGGGGPVQIQTSEAQRDELAGRLIQMASRLRVVPDVEDAPSEQAAE